MHSWAVLRRRTTPALAVFVVLVASGPFASATTPQDVARSLEPVQVAINALPVALASAIDEAHHKLLADVAIAQLNQTHAYVQGFTDLPQSGDALGQPDVRGAYAWVEAAVETMLAVPPQLAVSETAAASCEAYGTAMGVQRARTAIHDGRQAVARIAVLAGALAQLNDTRPTGVDTSPFSAALGMLETWQGTRGAAILDCLARLAAALPELQAEEAAQAQPRLAAVVLPEVTWRTARVTVVGSWPGPGIVQLSSPSLGWSAQPGVARGGFSATFTVPRSAQLGAHDLDVTAGGQTVALVLDVELAPVRLDLAVPARVLTNTTFLARVHAATPPGGAEADRANVRVQAGQAALPVLLHDGFGRQRFSTGDVGSMLVTADYPGTDILAPAHAEARLDVVAVAPPAAANHSGTGASGTLGKVLQWLLVLLVILLVLCAIALGIVIWLRARGQRLPPLPVDGWPGAASFVAAMGILFDLLRRLRLVPPGRTVREWSRPAKVSDQVADTFEKVRYGGWREHPELTRQGHSFGKRFWEALRR